MVFTARMSLGLVLLWAGVSKLRDIKAFLNGLAAYRLIPQRLLVPVGGAVVALELLASGLLLIGIATRSAFLLTIVLLTAFGVAIAATLMRGGQPKCHCFGGSDDEVVSLASMVRIALLLGVAAAGYAAHQSESSSIRPGMLLPVMTLVLGLISLIRLLGLVSQAIALFRTPAVHTPVGTRRVSFRHQPLEVSLKTSAHLSRNGGPSSGLQIDGISGYE